MKRIHLISILAACVQASGLYAAAPTAGLVWRDVVTHEQLVVRAAAAAKNDPMLKLPPSTVDETLVARPQDILTTSDIISFGGLATLVPKRAILQIPVSYRDRITYVKGSKFKSWPDFFRVNRGWISALEVSREQAEGKDPIDAETRKVLTDGGNLVVAVYKGGPISVLPLKDDKAATDSSKTSTPAKP